MSGARGDPRASAYPSADSGRARTHDLTCVRWPALPETLARLHRELPVGAEIGVALAPEVPEDLIHRLAIGAGFESIRADARPIRGTCNEASPRDSAAQDTASQTGPPASSRTPLLTQREEERKEEETERREGRGWIHLRRLHSLADSIRPDLRLLVCGLNPSPYAADTGMPFGRPGNRFWPAALEAGIVPRDRDLEAALAAGVGFTDLVKRTTRRASELAACEYAEGLDRLARLARAFQPRVVCFVGLDGYRRAVRRNATPGWITHGFASCLAYLMPSTSGLNAHETLDSLVAHLAAASQAPVPHAEQTKKERSSATSASADRLPTQTA